MKKSFRLTVLTAFLCLMALMGCSTLPSALNAQPVPDGVIASDAGQAEQEKEERPDETSVLQEHEYYYDLQNVVLYLEEYGHLPDNFLTKDEASELGWEGGSVENYKKDAAIGGNRFGNREGILPEDKYYECDIDTHGYKNRGSRRLIYTLDGTYYYTPDHYKTFREVLVKPDHSVELRDDPIR